MILTQEDIDDFNEEYSKFQYEYGDTDFVVDLPSERSLYRFYRWLSKNPQVLMAARFQEYVGAHKLPLYKRLVRSGLLMNCSRPVFREFEGEWILLSHIDSSRDEEWEAFSIEALRSFYLQNGDSDEVYYDASRMIFSMEEIMSSAQKAVGNESYDPTIFVSPKLWTPFNQEEEKNVLQSTSLEIIRELQSEKIELQSIKWQTFEEIVAEILRSRGMEIHVVRESPQGGRDVIARGELIPGMESVTIAVEVKHRHLVDRPLVQQALYQNRNFPALLFVTSGRFTSGVIQEAKLPTNRMRLFLKDGVAIRELIKSYKLT